MLEFNLPLRRNIPALLVNAVDKRNRPSRATVSLQGFYRDFHDYFITHVPRSSSHSRTAVAEGGTGSDTNQFSSTNKHQEDGASHKPLPIPHSVVHPRHGTQISSSRDSSIVRIPLRSAKQHFGVGISRGTRPYNEDTFQAGVIALPAFAERVPGLGRARRRKSQSEQRSMQNEASSPKGETIGYTSDCFDGSGIISSTTPSRTKSHPQCQTQSQSRDHKEHPILPERAVESSHESSSTNGDGVDGDPQVFYFGVFDGHGGPDCSNYLRENLHEHIETTAKLYGLRSTLKTHQGDEFIGQGHASNESQGRSLVPDGLMDQLLKSYKENIGGYFQRFDPIAETMPREASNTTQQTQIAVTRMLLHTFLQTDLDFLLGQQRLSTGDKSSSARDELPINYHDSLFSDINPSDKQGKDSLTFATQHTASSLLRRRSTPFLGGSTASVALVSTPTVTPFWHPAAPETTLITAHVGDTRILLCRVLDGSPQALTTNHHPSAPSESTRLRRFSGCFMATDSFGEERMSGLANTRSFGDLQSKRLGVSAEPEIRITSLPPAAYSFLLMVSDGVSNIMSDQEMVDLVKEASTPETAARDLVSWATDVAVGEGHEGADNATALVIRLGGWERRQEGGGGSLATREQRNWRRREASEARSMARSR